MYKITGLKEDIIALSHGSNEEREVFYEVSQGEEKWGNNWIPACKVRMVYKYKNGKRRVIGSMAPTFPVCKVGLEEFEKVQELLYKYIKAWHV